MQERVKELKITVKNTLAGPEKENFEELIKSLDNVIDQLLAAAASNPNFKIGSMQRCGADGNLEVSITDETLK